MDLVERLRKLNHRFLNEVEGEYVAVQIGRAADRIEALEALLERAKYLFAHGVGAMTDNGDKDNQERNLRVGGELMLEITKTLSKTVE